MEEFPKKFKREVRKRPHSAAVTNRILGLDFEDSVGEDAPEYYKNIRHLLLTQGLEIKNVKTLELGSGDAVFLNYLKEKGINVVGVDVRPRGKNDLQVLARIEQLPFADRQFDVVLSLGNVFDDFIYDQDQDLMLKEVHRVLQPGGLYIGYGFYRESMNKIVAKNNFKRISPKSDSFHHIFLKKQ